MVHDLDGATDGRVGGGPARCGYRFARVGDSSLTCATYFFLERYQDAVAACEHTAGVDNWWVSQMFLTAAYAHNGDARKAALARDELLKWQPGFTIDRFRQIYYSGTPAYFDLMDKHLAPELRKAGMPEQ
jgi:hypothetical protein